MCALTDIVESLFLAHTMHEFAHSKFTKDIGTMHRITMYVKLRFWTLLQSTILALRL